MTASQVFDFLDRHPSCSIQRYEIHSAVFGALRRNIRTIVARLNEGDDDDSKEVAASLRMRLSEWLTVPVSFDGAMLESVYSLGDAKAVEARWGREVRLAYDLACLAARKIQDAENPARTQIRDMIRHLRSEGREWRIYCHPRARIHFESIFPDAPLEAGAFLHSVRDYRDVQPFDALIKVGPLRSRGWGSAPDAVLSAPRFETLVQIVWSGCPNEDDFGYDPVSERVGAEAATGPVPIAEQGVVHRAVTWIQNVIRVGDPSDTIGTPEGDELRFFYELSRASEMRRATLVQIDEQDGILYPPHSQVATFDAAPSIDEPISYRLPGETLTEGMFVIWPLLGAADLGALQAGEGHYSHIWKKRLREEFRYTPNDLLRRLKEDGIELKNLRSCVRQWCRPASTVIHAPQQRRHFETLIRVLAIDHDASGSSSRALRRPWWEYAWSEIGHARGEAIQSGMQEHEIIDEQLFAILHDRLPEIQRNAQMQDVFQVEIPSDKPLKGAVRFYRVLSIEEGFLVPDTILKMICDLDTIEQWRV